MKSKRSFECVAMWRGTILFVYDMSDQLRICVSIVLIGAWNDDFGQQV